MPKPSDEKQLSDDWDEHRRKVIGLGENSFRKNYYPELRRNIVNVKNLVQAIEQSPQGIFICVRDGSIEFVNGTLLRLSGCNSGGLIGKTPHALWSNSIQGDSCETVMQQIAAGLPWKGDLLLKDKSGKEIWVEMSVVPILDDTGDLTHFLGSMEDISVRKLVEEELKAVALARTRALEAAEHLSALKSEFMANMSHELRTPLNGVLGFAEIGRRNFQNAGKALDAFNKIKVSGEQLLGAVIDVLDFSRLDTGRLAIEQTEVFLAKVIDQTTEVIRDRAHAKSIELRVELASDLPQTCIGDPLRIGQTLLNVMSNAVKFTEAGCVTLSVWLQDERLVFRVVDSGIGMTPEQLSNVFNPFQQADGSATRRFGGTGLGLAISQRLLELMSGDIRIDSQPSLGTTVEFRLPYRQPPLPPAGQFAAI